MLNRLALHSWQLKFTGPGEKLYDFEASVPKDLKAILQQLSKRKVPQSRTSVNKK